MVKPVRGAPLPEDDSDDVGDVEQDVEQDVE